MSRGVLRSELELSYWPVVVLTVRNDTTVAEYESIFDRYERDVFARDERYVSITNLMVLSRVPGPAERRVMAEWMRRNDERMSRLALGNSTVSGSPIVRGAVTALYWVFKPSIPQVAHASLFEAVDWAAGELARGGREAPSGLREWARRQVA